MPAPKAKQFEADIKDELSRNGFLSLNFQGKQYTGSYTGVWQLFIEALTRDWMKAWQDWQNGGQCFKSQIVTVEDGVSIPPHGVGGQIIETVPVDFIIRWPYRRHQRFLEFEDALVTVIKREFTLFMDTWTVETPIEYAGGSTHTPVTPGVFTVTQIEPLPILDVGSGDNPDKIRPQVEELLEARGWRVKNPYYRTGLFLDAIDYALKKNFAEWLEKTKIIGDVATGPAAPGNGFGIGTSISAGKLL